MGSPLGGQQNLSSSTVIQFDKGFAGLLRDFKSLQNEGSKNGDLTFTLKSGQFVKAHSLIIKTRCKRFKEETTFSYISQDIFTTFLTYVYTGKLKIENLLSVFPLYLLSLEFGLEDLSSICEEILTSSLDANLALQILKEAVPVLSLKQDENSKEGISDEEKDKSTNGTISVKSAIKKLTPTVLNVNDRKLPSSPNANSNCSIRYGEDLRSKISRVIDTCIIFLSENNPTELKHNAQFLDLPVGTIKMILDSEHLCMEEEEVWRCVLSWAKKKAGVDRPVAEWSEEQRLQVSEFLTPVISHVKLLLIDSRVFAEEVEPTGCVKMNLILERYRFAALSSLDRSADGPGSDPRLTPRNAQKLFHSSMIINNERASLGKKLQEWHLALSTGATPNTNWKCVYRASQHGFGAEDFHSRVDGLSPTCVIILLKNSKWVVGGYTDVPWGSTKSPKFVSSSKCFLFALNPTTNGPEKFNVSKKHFGVCHDANSGPIFGAGADLYISSGCGSNTESYSNFPHSFDAGCNNGTMPYNANSPGSRSTTPSSPSPTGLDLPVIQSSILNSKKGKLNTSPQGGLNSKGVTLTPSYHFAVAEYEVFVPIV